MTSTRYFNTRRIQENRSANMNIAGEEPLTGAKVWDGAEKGVDRSESGTPGNAHDDSEAKAGDDVRISEIKTV